MGGFDGIFDGGGFFIFFILIILCLCNRRI